MMILKLLNTIVLELINSAHETNDQLTLLSMGLNADDARRIAGLTPKERQYIIEKGINLVHTQVDMAALIESVQRCQEHQSYEQVARDAILLGATREIMHQYARMSGKQFSALRQQLGVEKAKSYRLDDDQIHTLTLAIHGVVSEQKTEKYRVTLAYLVNLAKKTELPIGSIHAHLVTVWGEKYELR